MEGGGETVRCGGGGGSEAWEEREAMRCGGGEGEGGVGDGFNCAASRRWVVVVAVVMVVN